MSDAGQEVEKVFADYKTDGQITSSQIWGRPRSNYGDPSTPARPEAGVTHQTAHFRAQTGSYASKSHYCDVSFAPFDLAGVMAIVRMMSFTSRADGAFH